MTEFTSSGVTEEIHRKLTLLNSIMVGPQETDSFTPLTSSVVLLDTVALF